MKVLHSIVILCIASNISLYSMNIVSQQKLHKFTKMKASHKKTKRSLSINGIKKNLPNINSFANFGNIISASMTVNPIYLLPIISQTLQITSDRLYSCQNPTEFSQDLAYLINNHPDIITDLETLKKTTKKINLLKEDEITGKVINKNEIADLEEQLTKIKFNLIKETSPLLKRHNQIEISQYLQNYKELLKLRKWHSCCWKTAICSMLLVPMAVAVTSSEMLTTAELAANVFICFNSILAGKNIVTSYTRLNQADDYCYYVDFSQSICFSPNEAIQILEIYKTHMEIENNKLNQTNE